MNNLSTETNELFKAFAKFQGELENASKDKAGHGYKYADLANCINTAKPHLASNGLAVSQMLGMADSGRQTLITMLTHESGQWMKSEFVMVDATLMGGAGKNPAQVLGSAITYQRRYAFAAIIGLSQEDDDAQGIYTKKQQREQQVQVRKESVAKTIEQANEALEKFKKEVSSVTSAEELMEVYKAAFYATENTPAQQEVMAIKDIRKKELGL